MLINFCNLYSKTIRAKNQQFQNVAWWEELQIVTLSFILFYFKNIIAIDFGGVIGLSENSNISELYTTSDVIINCSTRKCGGLIGLFIF